MAPDVERQVAATLPTFASSYAIRDVTLSNTTTRLRVVVIRISDQYNEKVLDDVTGLGGRNSAPQRTTIGGVAAFFHFDVTPNFLAWQQQRFLSIVYGTDGPAMERLAGLLIDANR